MKALMSFVVFLALAAFAFSQSLAELPQPPLPLASLPAPPGTERTVSFPATPKVDTGGGLPTTDAQPAAIFLRLGRETTSYAGTPLRGTFTNVRSVSPSASTNCGSGG